MLAGEIGGWEGQEDELLGDQEGVFGVHGWYA